MQDTNLVQWRLGWWKSQKSLVGILRKEKPNLSLPAVVRGQIFRDWEHYGVVSFCSMCEALCLVPWIPETRHGQWLTRKNQATKQCLPLSLLHCSGKKQFNEERVYLGLIVLESLWSSRLPAHDGSMHACMLTCIEFSFPCMYVPRWELGNSSFLLLSTLLLWDRVSHRT